MSTTELVPTTSGNLAEREGLSLPAAQVEMAALVSGGEGEVIEEVARRAEAHALYERRAGDHERERHFACLRLMAEAALGALSFDSPETIDSPGRRQNWRTLAAAFERDKLLTVCSELERLDVSSVVHAIRSEGWTSVPAEALGHRVPLAGQRDEGSIPWAKARGIARRRGIAFDRLPSDRKAIRRRRVASEQEAARMRRIYTAADRQECERRARAKRAATTKLLSAAPESELAKATALLRRTTQAVDRAKLVASGPMVVEAIDSALAFLFQAEDALADATEWTRYPDVNGEPGIGPRAHVREAA